MTPRIIGCVNPPPYKLYLNIKLKHPPLKKIPQLYAPALVRCTLVIRRHVSKGDPWAPLNLLCRPIYRTQRTFDLTGYVPAW